MFGGTGMLNGSPGVRLYRTSASGNWTVSSAPPPLGTEYLKMPSAGNGIGVIG